MDYNPNNHDNIIPIVDENDLIICYKDRNSIKTEDIYRVSVLWITNSKGNILLAKRSKHKKNDPNKWGPAVAGTVEKDESYYQNIIKEADEELGLKNIKPEKGKKIRRKGKHNYFSQTYYLRIDKEINEFKIKRDEVEEIKWYTKEELDFEIKTNPGKFLHSIVEKAYE